MTTQIITPRGPPGDITGASIIYYASLLCCIALGNYYKQITNKETKQNYGTGLGLLVTYLICGYKMYHSALIVWGNIIILKCCDKKYVHQMSLVYTWVYLVYMSCNIEFSIPPYELWIHQVIALRLVGLAFEIYLVEKTKVEAENKAQTSKTQTPVITSVNPIDKVPSTMEIIAYSYYFIGLHRGPYYRWKIFQDHFDTPFGILSNCRIITEHKLKKAFVFTIMCLVLQSYFPIERYYEDYFYKSYGTDNRYLYNIPQLAMYCLQTQVIMQLCTSVCTEAGFGVYPAKCVPVPGHGPSARLSLIKLATSRQGVALEEEYNFGMLRSFENKRLIFGPKMRDTLRAWDISTRYWFWAHTYRSILRSNKEVRSAMSFLAWMIWYGPTTQQLIFASTIWVHIQLEAEYTKLLCNENPSMKVPWDIGFSIMRVLCLTYLTPCIILYDAPVVLRYYNSIYWSYHFLLLFLILAAIIIHKSKNDSNFFDTVTTHQAT